MISGTQLSPRGTLGLGAEIDRARRGFGTGNRDGIIPLMSRVVYTETPTTSDQETLRRAHHVRLVEPQEEGTGLDALPRGVFGFTYSPALPNAPLFAARRYRTYEIHKTQNGEAYIVGFATPEDAARLESAVEEITIRIQPQPEDGAGTLVEIPYSRIRHHRQYAAPNQHGFTMTVTAASREART